MEPITTICQRFYTMLPIPLALVKPTGEYVQSWPEGFCGIVRPEFAALVLEDFKLQKRDPAHPLINYVPSGFFIGVIALEPELFLFVGLASPFRHSQKELLEFGGAAILPDHLQAFVSMLMNTPIVTLPQLRSYMCLLTREITHSPISEDDILFSDSAGQIPYSANRLSDARFRQREAADPHAATNYENGVCDAIALGRADLLVRQLAAPTGGSVGMMSPEPDRQLRYSFISFATLVTRAAIRGGLPEETAFLLSDLYCQRMDSLSGAAAVQQLTVGMAMDFCEKVAKSRLPQQVSPVVQKALSYITVHLHESFGMEELSRYCSLCRRSLTIRFQKEVGMTVGEYIQREKTEEAKFLLRHTDISLSEIASYLNYSSQSYFTQIFKALVGKTPRDYRAAGYSVQSRR